MRSHEFWRNLVGNPADFHTWKNLKIARSPVMGRPPERQMHSMLSLQNSQQGTPTIWAVTTQNTSKKWGGGLIGDLGKARGKSCCPVHPESTEIAHGSRDSGTTRVAGLRLFRGILTMGSHCIPWHKNAAQGGGGVGPFMSTGQWRAWEEDGEGPCGRWNLEANGDILCWRTE